MKKVFLSSIFSRVIFLQKACICLLAAGIIFSGCKKDDEEDNVTLEGVYVVGSKDMVGDSNVEAVLWVDGVAEMLAHADDPYESWVAESVFLSGNDVYAAGRQVHKNNGADVVAAVWKNGEAQIFPSGYQNRTTSAFAVFVAGNDVYVVGITYRTISGAGEQKRFATLWRNGVTQFLPDGGITSGASSVYVSGGNVYVTGYIEPQNSSGLNYYGPAVLWRNGVSQRLSENNSSRANSVFVVGNDVYVAGSDNGAVLWKNGVAQQLATTGTANSVFVVGTDVYVAGSEDGSATLWINGEPQRLKEGAGANSVYVKGDDVYVVGGRMLWKNGLLKRFDGNLNSIFVK